MVMRRELVEQPLLGAAESAAPSLWHQILRVSRMLFLAAQTAARVEGSPPQHQREVAIEHWLKDGGDAGS